MIPAMGLNTDSFSDFSGGINMVDTPLGMDHNELFFTQGNLNLSTKNVQLMGKGERLVSRQGCSDLSVISGALPDVVGGISHTIGNIYTYRVTGIDKFLMSSYYGGIWRADYDGTNLTIVNVRAEGGVDNREWIFQHSTDSSGTLKVYALNGTDTPQVMDSSTGTLVAWPGTPPNGTCLHSWKNRMIVTGVAAQPQRLYYSDINNPASWPANNFIDIKSVDDESDYIIGLEIIGENLMVFKRNSVWVIFDPVTFDNRRLANVGLVGRKNVCSVQDLVYWVSLQGIFSSDGDTIREESIKIRPIFDFIKVAMDSGGFPSLMATYEGNLLWINTLQASNLSIGVWELNLGVTRRDGQHPWFYHGGNGLPLKNLSCATRAVLMQSGTIEVQPCTVGVYKGPSNHQIMAIIFQGLGTDNHVDVANPLITPVDAQYITPWIALQGSENKERLRRINVAGRSLNTITVKTFVDLDNSVASFQGSIAPFSGNMGRIRPESRGRYHQILFQMSGVESPSSYTGIDVVELKYRGGKEH